MKPKQSHLQQKKGPNQENHLQNEELNKEKNQQAHQDLMEYFEKYKNVNRDSIFELCDQTEVLAENMIRNSQKNSEKIKNTGNSNKDTEEFTAAAQDEQKLDILKEENDDDNFMIIHLEEGDNNSPDEEKNKQFESNNPVKNGNKIPVKDEDKIQKKDENKIHEKKEERNLDDLIKPEFKISDCFEEEEDDEIEGENTIKNDRQVNLLDEYLNKEISSGDKNDNINVYFREYRLENPESVIDDSEEIKDNCFNFQFNGNLSKKRKRK